MAYLMNVCQHLPQPSLSLPSDSWTKQPWWQGWEFSMNLATLNSVHQGWPGYSHCWMSSIPTIEIDPDVRVRVQFWCGTILWGDEPATWWQVDYLKALSLWNWMTSCFYWNITLRKWFCFPCPQCFHPGYHDCHIHCHGIPHSITSELNLPEFPF